MGVALQYDTLGPPSTDQLAAIRTRFANENEGYEWWCEPLFLFDEPNANGSYTGFTKLFCMIDDPLVDTYMAYLDIKHIISVLQALSDEYGIDWRLALEGKPMGRVENGHPSHGLLDDLDLMVEAFRQEHGDRLPSRAAVLEQYRVR